MTCKILRGTKSGLVLGICVVLLLIFCVGPLFWITISSFKPKTEFLRFHRPYCLNSGLLKTL